MNTVTWIGNIGRDAETRRTQGGIAVTSFTVASNDGPKDKPPVWARISLWREYGEKLQPYLTKGTLVAVTGRIDQEPQVWTGKDGTARASLEITGDRIRLLGGGSGLDQREAVAYQAASSSLHDANEIAF